MRLEAVGQPTGGITREVNNLLAVILGSLERLDRQSADDKHLRWVGTAIRAAQRGAAPTQQLLAYARTQFMPPDTMDIPAALDAMTELIRGSLGSRTTLGAEFSPDP